MAKQIPPFTTQPYGAYRFRGKEIINLGIGGDWLKGRFVGSVPYMGSYGYNNNTDWALFPLNDILPMDDDEGAVFYYDAPMFLKNGAIYPAYGRAIGTIEDTFNEPTRLGYQDYASIRIIRASNNALQIGRTYVVPNDIVRRFEYGNKAFALIDGVYYWLPGRRLAIPSSKVRHGMPLGGY